MAALLQRVMAGREEQKKQRQMDLERLLQRSVGPRVFTLRGWFGMTCGEYFRIFLSSVLHTEVLQSALLLCALFGSATRSTFARRASCRGGNRTALSEKPELPLRVAYEYVRGVTLILPPAVGAECASKWARNYATDSVHTHTHTHFA